MADPYTLIPAPLDPTESQAAADALYAPTRQASFAATMLQTLKASPLRLYSWGRGNLPRRLVDVFAGELELLSVTVNTILKRGIAEATYLAWQDPVYFPPRGQPTLARGVVTLSTAFPLSQSQVIPAGSLFGSPDGRIVESTEDGTLEAGQSAVSIPVVSTVIGSGGNFNPGEISIYLSGGANFFVANPTSIAGGMDEESDKDIQTRFQDFVESRATASRLSLFAAAMNTHIPDPANPQAQMRPTDAALILPWLIDDLNGQMGYGYVVIDGGDGYAHPALLAAVNAKLELMEAAGDCFTAIGVNPWIVDIQTRASVSRTANLAAVQRAMQSAWTALAHTRLIEDGRGRGRLSLFDIEAALEASHPDVVSVQIMGASQDLQPPIGARILPGVLSANLLPGGAL